MKTFKVTMTVLKQHEGSELTPIVIKLISLAMSRELKGRVVWTIPARVEVQS